VATEICHRSTLANKVVYQKVFATSLNVTLKKRLRRKARESFCARMIDDIDLNDAVVEREIKAIGNENGKSLRDLIAPEFLFRVDGSQADIRLQSKTATQARKILLGAKFPHE
jgi:hypothetical protein